MMRKYYFILIMSLCCSFAGAQEKSKLQQRAEEEAAQGKTAAARTLWIRAYEDYTAKGQTAQAVEAGVKATALYYGEYAYKEAFELLHLVDQAITSDKQKDPASIAAWRYKVVRERMQMYIKMRKSDRALEQINNMERHAVASGDEQLKNDLLYNRAIYHYTFGQIEKGNAVFKEMAAKLMGAKDYDKVDDVYKALIESGLKSGSVNMVSQAYSGYIAWKDSVNALKAADERHALKEQIAQGEAAIAEKDSALTSRGGIIAGLCVLSAILVAALVIVSLLLLRIIVINRKQKKTIRLANENNALKAKFISNISAQLTPTLQQLDAHQPQVKALQDFAQHIQTLSQLETTIDEKVELEDTALQPFCEQIVSQVRDKAKTGVMLNTDVPKMTAMINREYVEHVLLHLLRNAAKFTPVDGHIRLEYKKRGAHKQQFLVSNTGSFIPEEKREDIFKPFLEVRDLTTGDGLGLPICRQMALKMNGNIELDPEFTKGTRFVLNLGI